MVRVISCSLGAVITVSTLALAVSGCSRLPTKHEVMTVIFTGVPEPGAAPRTQERTLTPSERREALLKERRRLSFKEPELFAHGPFAANQCESCHDAGGTKGAERRIGPKLAYPIEELCLGCHSDKSGDLATSLQLAVHEPVTKGMCVSCHDPHNGKRPYMLRGADSVALCMTCHAEGKKGGVPTTTNHKSDPKADCLECHNPHIGKTARLLKSDFDEWQQYNGGG